MWTAVLLGCAACFLLKAAGFAVPQRLLTAPRVARVSAALPVALLAGLIAVQTFGDGKSIVLDVRLAGLGAALIAVWLRAPFLVVVVAGAATTALLRAVG
jgi:branched-subunit amino acid transport protein